MTRLIVCEILNLRVEISLTQEHKTREIDMKTIALESKTLIKDEKQLERAVKYCEENKDTRIEEVTKNDVTKNYLICSFNTEECETFEELVDTHSKDTIFKKFTEIDNIRKQDAKRNILKAHIEDKKVSESRQLAAILKASNMSVAELQEKLGITV